MIEESEIGEEEKRKKMREIKLHKYVGESSRSMYERGLEHLRDLSEYKKESHMLKHYLEHHTDEELGQMRFGAKIVKAARTAFNRQVGESVQIQENASKHEILNSKSEYNRCALPRLTTKMGENTVDKLEKLKREEIEKEKELMKRIRDLKTKNMKRQSTERREEVSNMNQPAMKKRKLTSDKYKRVHQDDRKAEKRGEEERMENYFPIFKKPKKNTQAEEEEMRKYEDEVKFNKKEEETDKKVEEEAAQIKEERIKKAEKLRRGWDLFRICKKMIEEEGSKWKICKERREIERKKEEE